MYFYSFVCYWLPDLFCVTERTIYCIINPQISFMDIDFGVICGRVQIS